MEFSLRDFACFDELVDSGLTVQRDGSPENRSCVNENEQVTCLIKMYMTMVSEDTLRVTLGTKKIIEGLEAGLYKYQVNETGYIIISPRLAYGEAGRLPLIAGDSHIVCHVTIIKVDENSTESDSIPELFLKNDGKSEENNGYNIYGGCHLLPKPTVVLEEEPVTSSNSNTANRKKSYENISILEKLEEEASDEVQEGIDEIMDTVTNPYSGVSITHGREFSITSLAAFDELMDNGIAVEYPNGEAPTGALIQSGYKVELDIVAMTWDGASTSTNIFAREKLSFIVGQDQVARGLDAAMLKLCNGTKATIIVAPKLGYGENGIKTIVPPNSHIVYDVTVTNVINASPKEYGMPAVGPEILLGLGNYDTDDVCLNQVELKVPGVVLEGSITDEELALAAKAMGLK